jgi:hypothetical protein
VVFGDLGSHALKTLRYDALIHANTDLEALNRNHVLSHSYATQDFVRRCYEPNGFQELCDVWETMVQADPHWGPSMLQDHLPQRELQRLLYAGHQGQNWKTLLSTSGGRPHAKAVLALKVCCDSRGYL